MKRRGFAGYTIIEVLVVLIVTGVLFTAVMLLLSGKQAQAEVNQAVRDLEAKLQTVASDVANGYYPNGFTCTADDIGSQVTLFNTLVNSGENIGCVFEGKVMNFTNDNIKILTVVGRQFVLKVGSADVNLLDVAKPVAVAQAGGPNVTDTYTYRYGMKVTNVVKLNGGATVGSIAFISQLGNGVSGNPLTGSRSTLLYGMSGSSPNLDTDLTTAAKVKLAGSLIAIPDGVRICLLGGNGKKAEITVGANGSQTSTFILIDSGVPAGDC